MWARVYVLRTRTRRDALGEQRAKNPWISWDILGLCGISWDILGYRVETARNRRMRWGLGWKLRDIVKLIRFVNQGRFPLLYCSLTLLKVSKETQARSLRDHSWYSRPYLLLLP